jgi:hypothetical protein
MDKEKLEHRNCFAVPSYWKSQLLLPHLASFDRYKNDIIQKYNYLLLNINRNYNRKIGANDQGWPEFPDHPI